MGASMISFPNTDSISLGMAAYKPHGVSKSGVLKALEKSPFLVSVCVSVRECVLICEDERRGTS